MIKAISEKKCLKSYCTKCPRIDEIWPLHGSLFCGYPFWSYSMLFRDAAWALSSWSIFSRKPLALTSINSAANPELASTDVCQRPIFCNFPPSPCRSFPPSLRRSSLPPPWYSHPHKGFSAQCPDKKGPGDVTPKFEVRPRPILSEDPRRPMQLPPTVCDRQNDN